jgi:hypothetical protein
MCVAGRCRTGGRQSHSDKSSTSASASTSRSSSSSITATTSTTTTTSMVGAVVAGGLGGAPPCHAASDCGNGEVCAGSTCVPVADGSLCDSDGAADLACGVNMQCVGGRCRSLFGGTAWAPSTLGAPCLTSRGCGVAQRCDTRAFQCTAAPWDGCSSHTQCGNGQLCFKELCANVSAESACTRSGDCGNEMLCAAGRCVPLFDAVGGGAASAAAAAAAGAGAESDLERCFRAVGNTTLRRAYVDLISASGPLGQNELLHGMCARVRDAARHDRDRERVQSAAAAATVAAAVEAEEDDAAATASPWAAEASSSSEWNPLWPTLQAEMATVRRLVLDVAMKNAPPPVTPPAQTTAVGRALSFSGSAGGGAVALRGGQTALGAVPSVQLLSETFDDDLHAMRYACQLDQAARVAAGIANSVSGGVHGRHTGQRYCDSDLACEATMLCVDNGCVAASTLHSRGAAGATRDSSTSTSIYRGAGDGSGSTSTSSGAGGGRSGGDGGSGDAGDGGGGGGGSSSSGSGRGGGGGRGGSSGGRTSSSSDASASSDVDDDTKGQVGIPCGTDSVCGNGQECAEGFCLDVADGTPCGANTPRARCGLHQDCLDGRCVPLYGSGSVPDQLRLMKDAFDAEMRRCVSAGLCGMVARVSVCVLHGGLSQMPMTRQGGRWVGVLRRKLAVAPAQSAALPLLRSLPA